MRIRLDKIIINNFKWNHKRYFLAGVECEFRIFLLKMN